MGISMATTPSLPGYNPGDSQQSWSLLSRWVKGNKLSFSFLPEFLNNTDTGQKPAGGSQNIAFPTEKADMGESNLHLQGSGPLKTAQN